MTEVKEMMVVCRQQDTEKVYLVWSVEGGKAKLCPFDVDSKNAGARRSSISLHSFWSVYELYQGE